MEWLALSIFISTVLFLVDKNRAWGKFSKWSGVALGVVIIFVLAYGAYSEHQHSASRETFYNVQPITPSK